MTTRGTGFFPNVGGAPFAVTLIYRGLISRRRPSASATRGFTKGEIAPPALCNQRCISDRLRRPSLTAESGR